MSVRIGVRRIVLFTTAACLLLASSHTPAQAPPAAPDAEQRLKALEDKMDRVLKLLESRAPAPATPQMIEKQMDLIVKARDELLIKYEKAQRDYQDFRIKSPFPVGGNKADPTIATQRAAKDEAVLLDLQQRQAEVAARSALVKNVGDNEKEGRALLLLVQRRGVDIDMLRRTAGTRRDEEVTALELVRLYGASLKQEAEELKQLIQVAEDRIDQGRRIVREMNIYQVTEEHLRTTKDQTAKLLDALVQALVQQAAKIEAIQNMNPKP
jgi:hypothetical protein